MANDGTDHAHNGDEQKPDNWITTPKLHQRRLTTHGRRGRVLPGTGGLCSVLRLSGTPTLSTVIDRFVRRFGATPLQRALGVIATAAALGVIVFMVTGHQGSFFIGLWVVAFSAAIGYNVAGRRQR
ncbi:MAG: hypothetical protein JWR52_1795 [Marmoricola sp.]|nr:hypothetical protein [Marmoricola sp.]